MKVPNHHSNAKKNFNLCIHYVANTKVYCTVVTAATFYATSLVECKWKLKWPHEDVLMFDLNVLYRRKHTEEFLNIHSSDKYRFHNPYSKPSKLCTECARCMYAIRM